MAYKEALLEACHKPFKGVSILSRQSVREDRKDTDERFSPTREYRAKLTANAKL